MSGSDCQAPGGVRFVAMPPRDGFVGAIGATPLIRIPSLSAATGCTILGKAEHLNPGGSVKDRAARAIVAAAEAAGRLGGDGPTEIVEGTAGNTGIGLALVARARGYRCTIVMPDNLAPEKIELLRALGADLHLVPPAPFADAATTTMWPVGSPRRAARSGPISSRTRPTPRPLRHHRPRAPGRRRPPRRLRRQRRHRRHDRRGVALPRRGRARGPGLAHRLRGQLALQPRHPRHPRRHRRQRPRGHRHPPHHRQLRRRQARGRLRRHRSRGDRDGSTGSWPETACSSVARRRSAASARSSWPAASARAPRSPTILCDGAGRYASRLFSAEWLAAKGLTPRATDLSFVA
jgi:hypothetical protein